MKGSRCDPNCLYFDNDGDIWFYRVDGWRFVAWSGSPSDVLESLSSSVYRIPIEDYEPYTQLRGTVANVARAWLGGSGVLSGSGESVAVTLGRFTNLDIDGTH